MSVGSNSELSSFYRFVSERLQGGQDDVSPEEALDLWRTQYPAADEADDTVLAVREALQDMDRGDQGLPIEQFDRDFRARHNLRIK
jgi:hypothetical protein